MTPFDYQLIGNISETQDHKPWLIQRIWQKNTVGIIGGQPKCLKTWLSLEFAIAVASGRKALGSFDTQSKQPVLIFPAEDDPASIRDRIATLCFAKNLLLQDLPIFLITQDEILLDNPDHRIRLTDTIMDTKPALLILDPLVRLHHSDENNAQEVAKLLSFLRQVQRRFSLAVILVHHMRKNASPSQRGQALRGSSDLHAWCDTNILLRRKDDHIIMSVEHRAAKPPKPIHIKLDDDTYPKLLVVEPDSENRQDLKTAVLDTIQNASSPVTRTALRELVKVKNERLGVVLEELEQASLITRSGHGWSPAQQSFPSL